MKIRSIVALSAAVLLLNIAVGGPAFADASVSVTEFAFTPSDVTIGVGETVTWSNDGDVAHTSTANGGEWDSGTLDPGDSFSHTFDTAGTFDYLCNFHPTQMTGTITVTEAGGTTEPAPSGTLPATGSDSSTGLFVWMGLLFLVTGGAALYLLRRRRA